MKRIIKIFQQHSVSVCGEKGSGKDLLFSNVCARRGEQYISNMDYKCKPRWIKLNFKKISVGNTYKNFLDNNIKEYIYPYKDGTDIYISDCGIFFPAQYCNELNRDYKDIPVFLALSRQLGNCRVHTNAQYLGRVWDKLREQSTRYILCLWSRVICGFVIQKIRLYERYDACETRAIPYRVPFPTFGKSADKNAWKMAKAQYEQQNGRIKEMILIYKHRSKYDDRAFLEMLENGKTQ